MLFDRLTLNRYVNFVYNFNPLKVLYGEYFEEDKGKREKQD